MTYNNDTPFIKQDKQAEIIHFNKFDGDSGYDSLTEAGYQTLLDGFVKMVIPKSGETVGDFGCGSAAFGQRVKDQCSVNLIGVDLNHSLIQQNIERLPHIPFYEEDIEKTSFDPETFDIIMYSGVLHHFPDFRRVAQEAYRLLKLGGRIFAFDPHYYNPAMWAYRAKASPIHSLKGRTINERLLTKKELTQVWSQAGFSKAKALSSSGVGISYLESKSLSLLLNGYNVFDNMLHWTGLDRWFGSFVLTCALKD